MRRFWIVATLAGILFSTLAFAQGPAKWIWVYTAPSGTCGNGGAEVTIVAGDLYTCASGTWVKQNGGGGGAGTVTNVATASPITGGPITTTGTIGCATCTTSAASLVSGDVLTGAGLQALQDSGTLLTSLAPLVSPSFTTPSLGAATATTINKVAITAPAIGSTLTIPDGVTLTGPAASGTTATLGNTESFTGLKTFAATGTTATPALLIQPTGTTAVTWTAGVGLGINAASGTTAIDIHQAGGGSLFSFTTAGNLTIFNTMQMLKGIFTQATGTAPFTVASTTAVANLTLAGESQVTGLVADLALKSPLASPTFTGTPAAPTAAAGTNTTQIATTAYVQSATGTTTTNCISAASPAVCGSARAGLVLIPTGTTSSTLTVNSSAVTANSEIQFYPDDTLGTPLSTTCNSTLATLVGGSFISARTAGVSFTITFNGTIAVNGVCGSFTITN
jgi:hypothetical protein